MREQFNIKNNILGEEPIYLHTYDDILPGGRSSYYSKILEMVVFFNMRLLLMYDINLTGRSLLYTMIHYQNGVMGERIVRGKSGIYGT